MSLPIEFGKKTQNLRPSDCVTSVTKTETSKSLRKEKNASKGTYREALWQRDVEFETPNEKSV